MAAGYRTDRAKIAQYCITGSCTPHVFHIDNTVTTTSRCLEVSQLVNFALTSALFFPADFHAI